MAARRTADTLETSQPRLRPHLTSARCRSTASAALLRAHVRH